MNIAVALLIAFAAGFLVGAALKRQHGRRDAPPSAMATMPTSKGCASNSHYHANGDGNG